MSFTDQNLKDLKEYCADVGVKVSRLTVLELIDRLEAAEALLNYKGEYCLDIDPSCTCDYCQVYKTWKKSAGKE